MAGTTYKNLLAVLVEESAREWVEEVLKAHGVEFKWTYAEMKEMHLDGVYAYYTVRVSVTRMFGSFHTDTYLEVGGVVGELNGISNSVIWDDEHNIIWMATESARTDLGIKEFKIA